MDTNQTPNEQLAPTESPSYRRLTDAERVSILQLHDRGWSQSAIARHLNRSVSTIHETLQLFSPTIDLAKRKLRAAASQMAENVIHNGAAKEHVRVLEGLDVLKAGSTQGGLTININGLTLAGLGKLETATPQDVVVEAEVLGDATQPSTSQSDSSD